MWVCYYTLQTIDAAADKYTFINLIVTLSNSFYSLLGHRILTMCHRRLCYLILGLIVVVVLIAHFVVWTVHYGTYVSTPCY